MGKTGSKQSRHLPGFLLLFLMDGEVHGGALCARWAEFAPTGWPTDTGAVYRVLRSLEEDKYVVSFWNTEQAGPAKRVYRITDAGKEMLTYWYQDIVTRKRLLDLFLRRYEFLVEQGALDAPPLQVDTNSETISKRPMDGENEL